MKNRILNSISRLWLFLLIGIVPSQILIAQDYPDDLVAHIKIKNQKDPFSNKLFGMFIENLGNEDVGNLVDDALWAELIDDRKFFYPVNNKKELIPVNNKETINQWFPVRDLEHVLMDTINPFVGEHSPKIIVGSYEPQGISQVGIALEAGKKYVGRVFLRGSPNISVKLSLFMDNGDSLVLLRLPMTQEYEQYNFEFTARKDNSNAGIQITGKGKGSFHIGAISLMPADNLDGFRADVIKLLKELNSGIYRWGGNFISGYDWRDGVGDRDKRPPRYEYAWKALEDNDVGTPEMIRFAELIGVELAMTVNTGFGDAHSAGEWVEYVNGASNTPMGQLRTKHGHPVPYNIKLWCVGNESYGWWQLGHISLEDHIIKHNKFVEEMLSKDHSIELVASGASIEEMTVTKSSYKTNGQIIPEYGSETDWTGGMLKHVNHIDYMSEHFYCSVNERFDLDKVKYVKVDAPLVDWTRRPANRIKSKAIHYTEYHKRIPKSQNIPVYLDEWAFYTNWVHPTPTLGVTIAYARGLHEMFRNTDLYKMAGFTFATSCLSFTDTDVDYNSTGLMFKLYQSEYGRLPVEVMGNSPQPKPKWPIGGDQPKINAGGDVYPLDVVAALTKDRKTLTVAVVNPTTEKQGLKLVFEDFEVKQKVEKWSITGTSVDAQNIVNKDPEVFVDQNIGVYDSNELNISPASINIFQFEIK